MPHPVPPTSTAEARRALAVSSLTAIFGVPDSTPPVATTELKYDVPNFYTDEFACEAYRNFITHRATRPAAATAELAHGEPNFYTHESAYGTHHHQDVFIQCTVRPASEPCREAPAA